MPDDLTPSSAGLSHDRTNPSDSLWADRTDEFSDPLHVTGGLHVLVNQVLEIHDTRFFDGEEARIRYEHDLVMLPPTSRVRLAFRGRLRMPAELAYEQLDAELAPLDVLPVFRSTKGDESTSPHTIFLVRGRTRPATGGGWISLTLFALTVMSVYGLGGPVYAAAILLILGSHELGHYFAARYHRTAASLPYFIPFPFGLFGTMGAFIRLREPMRNRKVLLDIGIAGPLAGLIVSLPILLIGLLGSEIGRIQAGGLVEGNSIVYSLSKFAVFGRFLPDGQEDVFINELAWAGWIGLLVTGLNLIPIGQLDGGHILYSWLGKWAKVLFYPIALGIVLQVALLATELLVFVLLIFLMGNRHAVPLDDITPLNPRRRNLALLALVIFALVYVPIPLKFIESAPRIGPRGVFLDPALVAGVVAMTLAVGLVAKLRRR